MSKLNCEKLFEETGKEYQKINAAYDAFCSGKITGKELNDITMKALSEADKLIESYETGNL